MSKKNSNPNKKPLAVLIVLIVVVIVACLSLMFINLSEDKTTNTETTLNSTEKTYHPINSDELGALLNESTLAYVYVGRSTCPHCAVFAPILVEAIKETDSFVHYYDTAAARTDDVDKLNNLMTILDINGVPALIKINNGEVVSRLNDYESKEATIDFLR